MNLTIIIIVVILIINDYYIIVHTGTSVRPFKNVTCFPPGLPNSRNTPSPIDPDSIQVPVGYEPDPADLALSSVPGQEMFDPRRRKFSAEELKPQPMIKKARKIFIPEDLKVIWSWFRFRSLKSADYISILPTYTRFK